MIKDLQDRIESSMTAVDKFEVPGSNFIDSKHIRMEILRNQIIIMRVLGVLLR